MSQDPISEIKRRDRPEYWAWAAMLQRCRNEKNPGYAQYGGRGIRVCDRWVSFDTFFEDMGSRPTPNHSIERKNNNGNYEPSNCIWADDAKQNNNTSHNVIISAHGMSMTMAQWSKRLGVSYAKIRMRLKAWYSAEVALFPGRLTKGATNV